MSVWVVVADRDLRALLLTVGEEAGLDLVAVEPEAAQSRLARGDVPEAILVARGALALDASAEHLARVPRLAIAAPMAQIDLDDDAPGVVLPLPASLHEVERVLHWLAWKGPQVARRSRSSDSSVRPAAN